MREKVMGYNEFLTYLNHLCKNISDLADDLTCGKMRSDAVFRINEDYLTKFLDGKIKLIDYRRK